MIKFGITLRITHYCSKYISSFHFLIIVQEIVEGNFDIGFLVKITKLHGLCRPMMGNDGRHLTNWSVSADDGSVGRHVTDWSPGCRRLHDDSSRPKSGDAGDVDVSTVPKII